MERPYSNPFRCECKSHNVPPIIIIEVIVLPTSSLTKNFVIDTEEMAQKFVNAIEMSEKDKRKFIEKSDRFVKSVNVRYYSDMSDEEKKEFIKKIFRK